MTTKATLLNASVALAQSDIENKLTGEITTHTHSVVSAFTTYVESGPYSIVAAGSVTWAHGLGVEPKAVRLILECVTANVGYSVGDKIEYASIGGHGSHNQGMIAVVDATNIMLRFANSTNLLVIVNKTTGTATIATEQNWRVIIGASA